MSEFQTRLNSVPSGGFLTDRDKDKKPILDVRELGIDFGGLHAVEDFNLIIGKTEIAGLKQKNAEERAAEKAEREQLEERFRLQFKNLATEILGEQSQRFKEP